MKEILLKSLWPQIVIGALPLALGTLTVLTRNAKRGTLLDRARLAVPAAMTAGTSTGCSANNNGPNRTTRTTRPEQPGQRHRRAATRESGAGRPDLLRAHAAFVVLPPLVPDATSSTGRRGRRADTEPRGDAEPATTEDADAGAANTGADATEVSLTLE